MKRLVTLACTLGLFAGLVLPAVAHEAYYEAYVWYSKDRGACVQVHSGVDADKHPLPDRHYWTNGWAAGWLENNALGTPCNTIGHFGWEKASYQYAVKTRLVADIFHGDNPPKVCKSLEWKYNGVPGHSVTQQHFYGDTMMQRRCPSPFTVWAFVGGYTMNSRGWVGGWQLSDAHGTREALSWINADGTVNLAAAPAWFEVDYGGTLQGWITKAAMFPAPPPLTATGAPGPEPAIKIYSSPSTKSKVVGSIKDNNADTFVDPAP